MLKEMLLTQAQLPGSRNSEPITGPASPPASPELWGLRPGREGGSYTETSVLTALEANEMELQLLHLRSWDLC